MGKSTLNCHFQVRNLLVYQRVWWFPCDQKWFVHPDLKQYGNCSAQKCSSAKNDQDLFPKIPTKSLKTNLKTGLCWSNVPKQESLSKDNSKISRFVISFFTKLAIFRFLVKHQNITWPSQASTAHEATLRPRNVLFVHSVLLALAVASLALGASL